MAVPLADHSLLLALPFVVPAIVIGVGLLVLVVRERAGGRHPSRH
jgi:ABC-type spermidine/putrescine transport system permease subunit II